MAEVNASAPAARVNVLILSAGLGLGGAETVIRHLAQAIDPKRFNITIGCIKTLGLMGEKLKAEGVDIVTLASPDKQVDYLTALALRKLIRARGIQVVHSHTTDGLADAALCKVMSPGLKVIHTFHFGNYPHTGSKRLLWMERVFSRLTNKLVAVGEVQRSQIRKAFALRASQIGMIWNGVQAASPATDPTFRARIGAGDRLIIGTVATLIEQKGLRDLIAVAARLRAHADKVCFVVVGDGHLRGELERLRHEQGVDDMVVFAGWVPDAASVALPAFDVFFQPSLWEAMSVAILEAMAAQKAIVATRVGENPIILDDGIDGLLVESKDVAGMADVLGRLIADPALRQRLGTAAAAKVARQFTVAQMARAYEALYVTTLAGQ
ncbi:MAG: glycosyltransferase [Acidobacteriota bacterium]